MANSPIPEELRRFILTSVPSVPFLEALLLMRADQTQPWRSDTLAARLYVREKSAEALLHELCTAGMAERSATPGAPTWRYRPESEVLRKRIDGLADLYASRLVEVTLLIHSTLDRKAQHFADAFKWRKDAQ
jgi:predicted transcriptional regulator